MAVTTLNPEAPQASEATHQSRFFHPDNTTTNSGDFRYAWDLLGKSTRVSDELETARALGRLTEEEQRDASALAYDKRRHFLQTAAAAVSRVVEKHRVTVAETQEPLVIGSLVLGVELDCLSCKKAEETILYGDPVLTNPLIERGYRLPTDEEWVELFFSATLPGALSQL